MSETKMGLGLAFLAAVGMVVTWMGGTGIQPAAAGDSAFSAEIKSAYKKHCKKCHGWDGKAQTKMGKKKKLRDLTTAEYQSKAKDDEIVKVIKEGWKDPENPKRKMKPYGEKLSDAEVKTMLAIVRAFAKAPGPFPDQE